MSKKISELTTATDVTVNDFFQVVDLEDPEMGLNGTNKKVSARTLGNNLPVTATGSNISRTLKDRFADTVNAKDFGAIGDGIADDTAAIQSFFNSFTNGGVGFIPEGTYKITSPLTLTINSGGFSIEGANANSTIFAAGASFSSTNPVLTVVTAGVPAGFNLGNFAVQNSGSSSLTGIRFGNESSSATVIVGYQFSNVHSLYCNGFSTLFDIVHARQITFSRCAGWNPDFATANTCLKIRQNGKFTADLRFEDCQFVSSNNVGNSCLSILSNAGPYNPLNGNNSCAGIKFRSCDFYAGEKAIVISAANSSWITDIWFVDGCQIDQEVVNGVYVESNGASTLIQNLNFFGTYVNRATAPQMNFVGTSSGQLKTVFIGGCSFQQGVATGINVFGSECQDFHVYENTFIDQDNVTGTCIEFNSAKNVSANNNRARRGALNKYAAYLITFSGSASNFVALGNDASGVVSTSVIYDTTGDVSKLINENLGFNPTGQSVVTVGASPFSFKNTAGYTQNIHIAGGTVSNININGFNIAYNLAGQMFTLATGSTLTVTYSVAPSIYRNGI